MSIPKELLQEATGRNHHELIKKLRGMIQNPPSDYPTDHEATREPLQLESRFESDPRDMKLEHLVRDAIRVGREEERRRVLALVNTLVAYNMVG